MPKCTMCALGFQIKKNDSLFVFLFEKLPFFPVFHQHIFYRKNGVEIPPIGMVASGVEAGRDVETQHDGQQNHLIFRAEHQIETGEISKVFVIAGVRADGGVNIEPPPEDFFVVAQVGRAANLARLGIESRASHHLADNFLVEAETELGFVQAHAEVSFIELGGEGVSKKYQKEKEGSGECFHREKRKRGSGN